MERHSCKLTKISTSGVATPLTMNIGSNTVLIGVKARDGTTINTYTVTVTLANGGINTTIAGNGSTGSSGDGGAAIAAKFNNLAGVAVDTAGNFFVAEYMGMKIRKITASTGIITTFAGTGTFGSSGEGDGGAATSAKLVPYAVAIDSAGNVYAADPNDNRIRKVTASTGIITTIAGNGTAGYSGDGGAATAAQLNTPVGVAIDIFGNVYVADLLNNSIRKITASTGIITTIAGNGIGSSTGDGGAATSATLIPQAVAVDTSGNIFVADTGNHRTRKITSSTGIITTISGPSATLVDGSSVNQGSNGVAVDAAGNVYVADIGNRIWLIQ